MNNNNLNNIVENFITIIEGLKEKGIIKIEDLQNHTESNLHSWLHYAMIKSGESSRLFSIPECKLRFSEPLDPSRYRLPSNKRKRGFKKVDVAFYDYDESKKSKRLVGFGEIHTMDEAHGAIPSEDLARVRHYWLTPRDSMIHTIEHALEQPKFVIIVTVLLKKSPRVFWPTMVREIDERLKTNKNYYEVFKPYWEKFKRDIRIDSALLIINENGVEKVENIY